jgi:hypothetical protein
MVGLRLAKADTGHSVFGEIGRKLAVWFWPEVKRKQTCRRVPRLAAYDPDVRQKNEPNIFYGRCSRVIMHNLTLVFFAKEFCFVYFTFEVKGCSTNYAGDREYDLNHNGVEYKH